MSSMKISSVYKDILDQVSSGRKLLAVLIDPDKFDMESTAIFLRGLPVQTTHIFVGGSQVMNGMTDELVNSIKLYTSKPVILFPGNVNQLTPAADAVLFLSLLSGNNSEYLIGQHVKAVPMLKEMDLEVIPTAYILIDGGHQSSVSRVTNTDPIPQRDISRIVNTAIAGQLMGKKMVYLEAGSGALEPVSSDTITAVKKELQIPLIVGGGIRTPGALQKAYDAGADLVVMGTAFEK